MIMIKPEDIDPTQMVDYGDGGIGMIMFHFAPPETEVDDIAEDQGYEFDAVYMTEQLAPEDPLRIEWEDGANILARWAPEVPEGFLLAAKMDSDDGPIAWFVKKLPDVEVFTSETEPVSAEGAAPVEA